VRKLILLALLVGCAGTELQGKVSTLEQKSKIAWDNGAYNCAKRQLALADSHIMSAELELDEGDYYRARQEIEIAQFNVDEAIRLSPREKCRNPDVVVMDEPKHVVVQRIDTDKDGLYDDEDKCPTEPEDKDGFMDEDGCPDPDNDEDGILDQPDKCPLVAEDPDKFEDDDGCPEEDNDKDGLADKIDQCPDQPEDKDGFDDDDGCPDLDNDKDKVADVSDKCPNEYAETADGCPPKYQLIVVTSEKIELKQTIYFDLDKSTIKPVSFPLLDEVASALKANKGIKVRVEGHTDSRGSDDWNMKLSQARAESVRAYLVGKGVAAERMEAKGFGETVAIADNRTETGRSQNRRVEFIILSQ
jgi:OmpA-OmpF porin, OOP family